MSHPFNQDYVEEKYHAIAAYLSRRENLRSIPAHIDRDLDYVRGFEEAMQFKPRDAAHAAFVEMAKFSIDADVKPMAARREFEDRVAWMITKDLIMTGLGVPYKHIRELPGKLFACRRKGYVAMTPQGDTVFRWEHKCNCSKICPDEARAESKRLAQRYLEPMLEYLATHRRAKMQYWVISPPNCPVGELEAYQDRVYKFYTTLIKRKEFASLRGNCRIDGDSLAMKDRQGSGSLVSLENPLSKDRKSWNVHLNVMAIIEGYFNWERFQEAWANEFGGCSIKMFSEEKLLARAEKRAGKPVSRAQCLTRTFIELVKYCTKITGAASGYSLDAKAGLGVSADEVDADDAVASAPTMDQWGGPVFLEWFYANHRFRRTRSYGVLYNINPAPEEVPVKENIATIELQTDGGYRYDCSIFSIPADKFTEQPRLFDSYDPRGPP